MRLSFSQRLAVLATCMVILIATIGVLAHQSRVQLTQVQKQFDSLETESSKLAGKLDTGIQVLHSHLLRSRLSSDPTDWSEFMKKADELRRWILQEKRESVPTHEIELLNQLERQLENYLQTARRFAGPEAEESSEADFTQKATELSNLVETLQSTTLKLVEAHQNNLATTISAAGRIVESIQVTIFVALGSLFITGCFGGIIVYREWIAPLQNELIEHKKLLERHEKLASLGALSAGVAHEIRNPLTAVKARLFTLRKSVAGIPSAVDDVEVVGNEVDRLEKIVRTFLRLARPPEPTITPVDTEDFLKRVANLATPQWASRQVEIVVETNTPPKMQADPEQLQQVLLNLIQNAGEAMPDGGRITLRAGAEKHSGQSTSQTFVKIDVIDTGPGISKEVQARLFDPFFTTKPAGTGLGLALSAGIIEKHEGVIQFQSIPGRGTTFSLLIPAISAS